MEYWIKKLMNDKIKINYCIIKNGSINMVFSLQCVQSSQFDSHMQCSDFVCPVCCKMYEDSPPTGLQPPCLPGFLLISASGLRADQRAPTGLQPPALIWLFT